MHGTYRDHHELRRSVTQESIYIDVDEIAARRVEQARVTDDTRMTEDRLPVVSKPTVTPSTVIPSTINVPRAISSSSFSSSAQVAAPEPPVVVDEVVPSGEGQSMMRASIELEILARKVAAQRAKQFFAECSRHVAASSRHRLRKSSCR